MIHDAGVKPVCCGEPMTELVANTTDAATEKHVPVVEVEGNEVRVKVGSAPHPMSDEHHIAWIYLQTRHGGKRKPLQTGKDAAARFLWLMTKRWPPSHTVICMGCGKRPSDQNKRGAGVCQAPALF